MAYPTAPLLIRIALRTLLAETFAGAIPAPESCWRCQCRAYWVADRFESFLKKALAALVVLGRPNGLIRSPLLQVERRPR